MRFAIYGFHHPLITPVIDRLREESQWEIPIWFGSGGDRSWTEDIVKWHWQAPDDPRSLADDPLPIQAKRQTDSGDADDVFDIFVEQMSRNPSMIDQPLRQYRLRWNALRAKFHRQLTEAAIDCVVFQNLPHEGVEWVLYTVARSLQIETLLLHQTILPGRFCYCWDLEDFGHFETAVPTAGRPPIEYVARFEKDLFYMRQSAGQGQRSAGSGARGSWQPGKLLRHTRRRWRSFAQALKRRTGIDALRGKTTRPIHRQQMYCEQLDRWNRRPHWNRRFVYFPLHLQPELTTSAIGGQYRDQLTALERLRDWLPHDIWIYVKENPKQDYRWRGPRFFERLSEIPGTILVDRSVDTYQLLRRSEFAATITGTVGWESITGGKPVLVFGRPWYLSLAGVHPFAADLDPNELCNRRVDPEELNASLQRLASRLPCGIVDVAYREMLPEFDETVNQEKLFQSLSTIAQTLRDRNERVVCRN